MASVFMVVYEEFDEELQALSALVDASADPKLGRAKIRVASANASTLLLAATFEEFIREMARAYARAVVMACESYENLPPKLAKVAWKRTMEALARMQLDPMKEAFSKENMLIEAKTKFSATYEFCRGDMSQDVYDVLIHNENNLRSSEINSLFNVSGLSNVCSVLCRQAVILELLHESNPEKANSILVKRINDFIDRRNRVAHSINMARSSGPTEIASDIELMRRFGQALSSTLENAVTRFATKRRDEAVLPPNN